MVLSRAETWAGEKDTCSAVLKVGWLVEKSVAMMAERTVAAWAGDSAVCWDTW